MGKGIFIHNQLMVCIPVLSELYWWKRPVDIAAKALNISLEMKK
jgi:hypothetical protein